MKLLKEPPLQSTAYSANIVNLFDSAVKNNKINQVEKLLKDKFKNNPKNLEILFFLAGLYKKAGRKNEMKATFKQFLRISSQEEKYLPQRVTACALTDDFPSLFKNLEQKLKCKNIGDTACELASPWGDDYGVDTNFFTRKIKILEKVKNKDIWYRFYKIVLSCYGKTNAAEVTEMFEKLENADRSKYGWMFLWRGKAYSFLGKFKKAEKDFRSAVRFFPYDWVANCFLAENYASLKKYDASMKQFDKILCFSNQRFEKHALSWKGQVQLWFGKYNEAVKTLKKAVKLNAPFSLCWLGAAFFKLKKYDEALGFLNKSIRKCPYDSEAFVWRGEVYKTKKRRNKALEDFNTALKVNPVNYWARINRALINYEKGNFKPFTDDFKNIPSRIILSISPSPLAGEGRQSRVRGKINQRLTHMKTNNLLSSKEKVKILKYILKNSKGYRSFYNQHILTNCFL